MASATTTASPPSLRRSRNIVIAIRDQTAQIPDNCIDQTVPASGPD